MDQLPFKEELISNNQSIRIFTQETIDEELKWHMDMEDRIIEPIGVNDWKFQFDNKLPFYIKDKIKIKKGEWHRIIKGSTELKIVVTKI